VPKTIGLVNWAACLTEKIRYRSACILHWCLLTEWCDT